MAPAIPGQSAGHQPLNSSNVRKLENASGDKERFLRSYLRSQESLLANYAQEGENFMASWEHLGDSPPAPSKSRLKDYELESGFGTPLLKPRALHRLKTREAVVENCHTGEEAENRADAGTLDQADACCVARKEHAKEGPHDHSGDLDSCPIGSVGTPSRPGKQSFPHKKAKRVGKKPLRMGQSRNREADTDEERRNRLAERRERRRVKKAIVDPKLDPLTSGEDEEIERQCGARRKSKAKAGKGLKMPAGLALMHGFTAANVGKNRLTLPFDHAMGVFNKGKASAKTAVKPGKATGKQSISFSEERFLSKSGDAVKGTTSNDDMSEPSGGKSSIASSNSLVIVSTKRKRSQPSSHVAASSRNVSPGRSLATRSPIAKHKRQRERSPAWDTELEDGKLPSESESEKHSSEFGDVPGAEGTVLMDTRTFMTRWASTTGAIQVETGGHTSSEEAKTCSPSIGPSQSASQAVAWTKDHQVSGHYAQSSKYFALAMDRRDHYCNAESTPRVSTNERDLATVQNVAEIARDEVDTPSCDADALEIPQNVSPIIEDFSPDPAFAFRTPDASTGRAHDSSRAVWLSGLSSPVSQGPLGDTMVDTMPGQLGDGSPEPFWEAEEETMDPNESWWNSAAVLGYQDASAAASYWDADTYQDPHFEFVDASPVVDNQATYSAEPMSSSHLFGAICSQPLITPGVEVLCADQLDLSVCHIQSSRTDEGGDPMWHQNGSTSLNGVSVACSSWATRGVDSVVETGTVHNPDSDAEFDVDFAYLEADLVDGSEHEEIDSDPDPSALGMLPWFSEGRALLMGVVEPSGHRFGLTDAEADVVRRLRTHWLPQRF